MYGPIYTTVLLLFFCMNKRVITPGAAVFTPGAAVFTPGAAVFTPGAADFTADAADFTPGAADLCWATLCTYGPPYNSLSRRYCLIF